MAYVLWPTRLRMSWVCLPSWKIFTKQDLRAFMLLWAGTPKYPDFIKNCVFILTCLNFSHLQSTLHLMQYTYQDIFFYCSKQFLNLLILMPLVLLPFFVSPLPHQQNVSLWGLLSLGNKKKLLLGQDGVNREGGGMGIMPFFGQKLLNTQRCGQLCSSPIMKWANALKESAKKKKKIH